MKFPSSHLQTHFVCQSSDKFGIIEHYSPRHRWKPMAMSQWRFLFSWTRSVGWHGFPAMCPFCIFSCYIMVMAQCCMFKFISLPPPPKKKNRKKKCLHCSVCQRHTPCVLEIYKKWELEWWRKIMWNKVMEICVFSKFKEEFLLTSGKKIWGFKRKRDHQWKTDLLFKGENNNKKKIPRKIFLWVIFFLCFIVLSVEKPLQCPICEFPMGRGMSVRQKPT